MYKTTLFFRPSFFGTKRKQQDMCVRRTISVLAPKSLKFANLTRTAAVGNFVLVQRAKRTKRNIVRIVQRKKTNVNILLNVVGPEYVILSRRSA